MTVPCGCPFPATNPKPSRRTECLRCRGTIGEPTELRDLEWEGQLLGEAVEGAERMGWQAPGFPRDVNGRLLWGAEKYGERNHLNHDCFGEALQEPPDGVAWAMLGLQALRGELDPEDFVECERLLLAAAAHMAAGSAAFLELKRRVAQARRGTT